MPLVESMRFSGENGAGKSTLINLLSGVLRPDEGTIRFAGQMYRRPDAAEAQRLGIAVVQQELSLSPIFRWPKTSRSAPCHGASASPTTAGMHSERPACLRAARSRRTSRSAGGGASARPAPDGGDRQGAVSPPKVLILDEPTSSLTAHEVRSCFRPAPPPPTAGHAILYISHRLNEVLELCEYVTVLKDGIRTADQPLAGSDPMRLVRLMVGRRSGDLFPAWEPTVREDDPRPGGSQPRCRNVQGIDLSIRRGEILGIGGLLGQGQEDDPARALRRHKGDGRSLRCGRRQEGRHDRRGTARGIAYVPADRKTRRLLLPLSIGFNLTSAAIRGLAYRGLRRSKDGSGSLRRLTTDLSVRGGTRKCRCSASPAAISRRSQSPNGSRCRQCCFCSTIRRAAWISRPSARSIFACGRWRRQVRRSYCSARTPLSLCMFATVSPSSVRVASPHFGRDQLSEEAIVAASIGSRQSAEGDGVGAGGRLPLYLCVQLRRNDGLRGLFVVVDAFGSLCLLFPGILSIGGCPKSPRAGFRLR